MLIVKFDLPCPTSPLSWVIITHRVNPTPLHGVMLSKIWQIGDLTNLTNLIFHAEAVGWDTHFNFFFFFVCVCLSYCLTQSSKLHNGFSLHLLSSEPCTGMHTQPLTSSGVLQGHCSLCTEQFRRSRCYTFLHTCFPRASYTCLAPRAITFWKVSSRLCQITMRLPAERAIFFSLLK